MSVSYLGNTLAEYAVALGVLIGGLIFVGVFQRIGIKHLQIYVRKTASTLDDFLLNLVEKTAVPLLIFGVVYLSLTTLTLHPGLHKAIRVGGVVLFTFLVVRFLIVALQFGLFHYWLPRQPQHDLLEYQLRGLMPAVAVAVWGLATVFLLDNLGFKVSTIIAGLGIGGIAIALAAQAVLADLFGYFAILFDKPFVIGDFIVIGTHMGTVEHIGIKTTRIRSLSGEQLVFGNKDLTAATIRNFKRMRQRRVEFQLTVVYDTETRMLREIPRLMRAIIASIPQTSFDRAHLKSYEPAGFLYEVVYVVLTDDYNAYMDIQQEINLRIKEEFERRNVFLVGSPRPNLSPAHT